VDDRKPLGILVTADIFVPSELRVLVYFAYEATKLTDPELNLALEEWLLLVAGLFSSMRD